MQGRIVFFLGGHGSQGHGCCSPGFSRAWRATLFNSWLGALCLPVAKDIAYASRPGFQQGNCPPSNLQAGSISTTKPKRPGETCSPWLFFLVTRCRQTPQALSSMGFPFCKNWNTAVATCKVTPKSKGDRTATRRNQRKIQQLLYGGCPFLGTPQNMCLLFSLLVSLPKTRTRRALRKGTHTHTRGDKQP